MNRRDGVWTLNWFTEGEFCIGSYSKWTATRYVEAGDHSSCVYKLSYFKAFGSGRPMILSKASADCELPEDKEATIGADGKVKMSREYF